jgi:hypothetical protein
MTGVDTESDALLKQRMAAAPDVAAENRRADAVFGAPHRARRLLEG